MRDTHYGAKKFILWWIPNMMESLGDGKRGYLEEVAHNMGAPLEGYLALVPSVSPFFTSWLPFCEFLCDDPFPLPRHTGLSSLKPCDLKEIFPLHELFLSGYMMRSSSQTSLSSCALGPLIDK